MCAVATELFPCPMLIDGDWIDSKEIERVPVQNPSTGEVLSEMPMGGKAEIDAAVEAAKEAFPGWSQTPPVERARLFYRYRSLLEENFDSIAELITREHGKTLGESRGGLYRGLENGEYACGIPTLLFGDTIENLAAGIDCETFFEPLGVCAGITPFNFPAMVPMWMFPLALACGNTFVFKPSEMVPLSSIRIIELLVEAGLPKGVLNLVHGAVETVDAILEHPDIKAVSFVGSTPVAKYIYETGTRHGKRVHANGSAKNYTIVMPDADINKSVEGITGGAFGCAGERCMASSTTIPVGEAAKELIPTLKLATESVKIGPTDRMPQPDLGPVISSKHRDRVNSLIASGEVEGAKLMSDGRSVKVPEAPNGYYGGATLVDGVEQEMTLNREEVFGPVLNVMRADNLEAALEIANRSPFGNGTAIYTESGKLAMEFKHRVKTGMVGINVAVPASMAMFPFAGWNASFFGDLHVQGKEGVAFYTQQKVITSRWFAQGEGDVWRQ